MSFDYESKGNKIHGIESIALSVICRVQSGKPQETLSLIRNNNTVKTGEHGKIEYILLPTKLDHNAEYTCEARSPLSNQPLRKTVQLNINCKLSKNIQHVYSIIDKKFIIWLQFIDMLRN